MVVDINPQTRIDLGLEQLGLLKSQQQRLVSALDSDPYGVYIVTSPARQGLTTTMYNLLRRHDPYTQSIMTVEHRMEKEIEGVNHYVLDANTDEMQRIGRVEAILRQAPQVLMVEHLDHDETARSLVDAADDVRIYAGMRYTDTFAALRRWIEMIGETTAAAQTLRGILCCCLVRCLCPTCRVPYTPDVGVLHKLNLAPERVGQLYRHSGQVRVKDKTVPCPNCIGLGYRGRAAVFELLLLDDEARSLLASRQINQLRSQLRRSKMLWLQEVALAKAIEGITSITEVTRVLSQEMGKR